MKKKISLLLALCMLIGTLTVLPVFADQDDPDETAVPEVTVGEENGEEQPAESEEKPTDKTEGESTEKPEGETTGETEGDPEEAPSEEEGTDYMKVVYKTKEDKLAAMTLMTERYGYMLYYEQNTGEVAVVSNATGDMFFTNPYDINTSATINDSFIKLSDATKKLLYSQLIIDYTDNAGNKSTKASYADAAVQGQIKVKRIKNGIRVEYIMGQQESRSLVPRLITKERLEEQILNNILVIANDETLPEAQRKEAKQKYDKISAFYTLRDPNDSSLADAVIKSM